MIEGHSEYKYKMYLDSGDVVAVYEQLQADHAGRGAPVDQALVQDVMHAPGLARPACMHAILRHASFFRNVSLETAFLTGIQPTGGRQSTAHALSGEQWLQVDYEGVLQTCNEGSVR